MRKIVKEIKTSNNQKKRSIMKKFTVCLSAFLLTFFLLSNAAYADDDDDVYPMKRLTITSAQVGPDNEIIYIHSKNFGNDPYVMLDEYELDIMDVTANTIMDVTASTLIQAWLPAGLESGTYRLLVAQRKPNGELNALKTDTMDLTIGAYTEIDPVFDAWDKSTGISITESQVTGLTHFTSADEEDPVFDASAAADITSAGSGSIITSEERIKLGGIEAGADITNAVNVAAAGAVMTEIDPTVNLARLRSLVTDDFHNLGGTDATLSEAQVDNYVADNGYLTSYTEIDPIFNNSPAKGITSTNITDWNTVDWTELSNIPTNIDEDSTDDVTTSGGVNITGGLNIATTSGNVGIGTTSPSARLVVGANLGNYSSERIVIGGSTPGTLTGLVTGKDLNNRGWMLWSVDNGIMVFGTKVDGDIYNTFNLKLGNVGIGVRPDSRLKIKGSGNTIATSGLNVTNSDNISSLFVRDDGNVGIGTESPKSALQVNGYIQLALTSESEAPPPADCDDATEEGRMKFNPTSKRLYICGDSGWVSCSME